MVDVVSGLERDGVRERRPSGLNRLGSDKFGRQIERYVALVTQIRGGDWSHYQESSNLAQQLGRKLERDLDQGVTANQIKSDAQARQASRVEQGRAE